MKLLRQVGDWVWAPLSAREKLQQSGVNVVPCNFYSNIPSIDEVKGSFEYDQNAPPYLLKAIFDEARMASVLSSLADFTADYAPPLRLDEEACQGFFWENSQFSYSDAMSYYGMIKKCRPRRVLEVGSGYSSLVALDALRVNGGELICVEPYPRKFIERLSKTHLRLKECRAQELDAATVNGLLSDGDILFIDSTHTVKIGSDCLHIYLRLLPEIRKKIYIHVHDIFLPFGMPQHWAIDSHIYWTEQYLLLAWLIDNPRAKLIYGSAYGEAFQPELMKTMMHGRYQAGGSSIWIEYN
jgi:hypothetical protein